jgi:hypothetical protein
MAQKVMVSIKGLSPGILMHRFPLEPIQGLEKKSPEEQAEYSCYRNAETQELYIPGPAVQQALVASATYSKGKGRGSLQKIVAASVFVMTGSLNLGTKKYAVDSRAVVVPATGGRVVRHRPLIEKWEASFEVMYDETLMDEKQMRKVVDDAGSLCGLLDYRPNCKGPFGRFIVTKWELSDDE